jgi:pyruvate, water dikinase
MPSELEFWDLAAITTAHRHAVGTLAWQLHELAQTEPTIAFGIVLSTATFAQICRFAKIGGKWPDNTDIQSVSDDFQDRVEQVGFQSVADRIQQHWSAQQWPENCCVKVSVNETIGDGISDLFSIQTGLISQLDQLLKQSVKEIFWARNGYLWQQIDMRLEELPIAFVIQPLIEPSTRTNLPIALPQSSKGLTASPGTAIGRAIVLPAHRVIVHPLEPHTILVTSYLTPDWIPLIKQVSGIITEQGGITSHAAIMARELGIPAIVGATDITQRLHTGDWLRIEAGRIEVIEPTVAIMAIEQQSQQQQESPSFEPIAPHPLLYATISHLTVLHSEHLAQVQGVGLIRAEHLLLPLLQGQHPYSWIQTVVGCRELQNHLTAALLKLLQQVPEKPIWYRTADWRSQELSQLQGANQLPIELNPALGLHGSLSYQTFPEWFDLELAAIAALPADERNRLRLLLPFVRTIEDVAFCRDRFQQLGLNSMPLWVMAEVPSVLFCLSDYVKAGIQGITIGLNDLTQLLLGVDRDNPRLQDFFYPTHPVVQQAIAQLIQACHQHRIPCHICLSIYDRQLIHWLVKSGIDGISVNTPDLERTRRTIVNTD